DGSSARECGRSFGGKNEDQQWQRFSYVLKITGTANAKVTKATHEVTENPCVTSSVSFGIFVFAVRHAAGSFTSMTSIFGCAFSRYSSSRFCSFHSSTSIENIFSSIRLPRNLASESGLSRSVRNFVSSSSQISIGTAVEAG